VDGWIKTLRTALGMSATQLARRLGVTKQAIGNMERGERAGTLSLTTYHKVAETLGCHLKVVLVPKKPLETIVQEQARQVATRLVKQTSHQMHLEAQETTPSFQKAQIEEMTQELIRSHSKKIWEDL
jgi:predicted DNA-binding mobile mystery protein A